MSANRDNSALEMALDDLSVEFDHAPDHTELRSWLDRHPELGNEPEHMSVVIDYVARWSVQEILVPDPFALPADPVRVARGSQIIARVVAALPAVRPITGLLADAANLSAPEAAARVGLSVRLFAQLDRRQLRFESLPERLFTRVADMVGRSVEDVRAYLSMPSALPLGAQFRSGHAPVSTGETQDFFDAVRTDPILSESAKREWLDLAPPARENA